jgi:aldehyde:ferredoxin oxidoreductase
MLMTDRAKGIPPLEVGPDAKSTPPFEPAKRNYYIAMGFDPETALPSKGTLQELGLDDVIKQLYPG